MILVLASGLPEFKLFIRHMTKAEQDQFRYVNHPDQLRGYNRGTMYIVLEDFFRSRHSARALEILDTARALEYVEVSVGYAKQEAFLGQWGGKETKMDWEKAKAHFDEVRKQYQDLEGKPGVNTSFALHFTFTPLARRFNSGERTKELYDEMMEVH